MAVRAAQALACDCPSGHGAASGRVNARLPRLSAVSSASQRGCGGGSTPTVRVSNARAVMRIADDPFLPGGLMGRSSEMPL